jgi:hypothetical protein
MSARLPALWLRLRLAVAAWSPVAVGAGVLCVAAFGSHQWLLQQRDLLAGQRSLAQRMAALPVRPPQAVLAPTADANLALFYGALGERRYAGQQVKTLFALASKSGLVLRQGEYKTGYDKNARVHTYQVSLPVKGSYRAIWQFALLALRTIPFAALDDISFRRDAIGESGVEARLRLTLYLADAPMGALP